MIYASAAGLPRNLIGNVRSKHVYSVRGRLAEWYPSIDCTCGPGRQLSGLGSHLPGGRRAVQPLLFPLAAS